MSEFEAHVYCTCFQDGLTNEAPYPRSDLTVNRFGVVTLIGSNDHAEDPLDLWYWRRGKTEDGDETPPPCVHKDMKIINTIFSWPGSSSFIVQYPVFESSLAKVKLPKLTELIYRRQIDDYPSGGIWATASEAIEALAELHVLTEKLPTKMPAVDTWFALTLSDLLAASALTGNPIIIHYNEIIDGAW